MKTRFIPALITLIAAAIVSVINIIEKTELVPGLRNLLIAIIVFYLVGLISKTVINRTIEKNEDAAEAELEVEEDTAEQDSSTNDKVDEKVE